MSAGAMTCAPPAGIELTSIELAGTELAGTELAGNEPLADTAEWTLRNS